MRGGRYWARAGLRGNLREAALVVLIVALGAGATMALAAGARRTESAFRRLLAVSDEYDAFVSTEDEAGLRAIVASPLVADSLVVGDVLLHPVGVKCGDAAADYYPMWLPLDEGNPYRMSRPRVLSGRLPRPGVPDEVALAEHIAARLRLGVGDELRLFAPESPEDCADAAASARQPATGSLRVVGVVRHASEVGLREHDYVPTILPRAFAGDHPDLPVGDAFAAVRLRGGRAAFVDFAALAARLGGVAEPGAGGGGGPVQPALDSTATGLRVAAAVTALGMLVALALALARQADGACGDLRVLGALGVPRRGALAAAATPAVLAAGCGVAGAVVVAASASPLLPIGLARLAEPDPGLHADWTVLIAGAGAGLALGAALAGLSAGRAVRAAMRTDVGSGARRPSPVLAWLNRSGAPPWAIIGAGHGLGAGRRGGAHIGAVTGAVAGVTGVVAATLFGLSLDDTLTDRQRYGWGDWDLVLSPDSDEESASPEAAAAEDAGFEAAILADPAVEAMTLVRFRSELVLDGEPVLGLVVSPVGGRAGPTVVSGRLPDDGGEIALGPLTARRLGVGVGDRVRAGVPGDGPASPLRVVGTAAFPAGEDGLPLAEGFVLTGGGWAGVGGDQACDDVCFRSYAVALVDGAEPAALADRMSRRGAYVSSPEPGAEIRRLHEVKSLPRLLAVLLAGVAVLGVAHALWVTPRQRRRELATLRALGFERAQVRRVLHTQAVVLALAGAAGGLLAGTVAGRLAWRAAAGAVGVPGALDIRPLSLLGVAAAAVAAARLLAVVPGRVAAAATPGHVLHEGR